MPNLGRSVLSKNADEDLFAARVLIQKPGKIVNSSVDDNPNPEKCVIVPLSPSSSYERPYQAEDSELCCATSAAVNCLPAIVGQIPLRSL